jgi:transcriptional regulator with XRE-family HTH domain
MASAATAKTPTVGELLRSWRERRSLSQLELSLNSGISTRHLSFVETGRAKPSREMVLHIAERLEVPLRDRNGLLLAAGFAPVYGERALEHHEMGPVRHALDRFLRAHEPYPALVVDGHWQIVAQNDALEALVEGVAPELLQPPVNALRLTLHPHGMTPRIVNFHEWSAHILHRLRRRAAITADGELEALYRELSGYPGVAPQGPNAEAVSNDIVLPLRLRHPEGELSFLGTNAAFSTANDVTVAELTVEAFYPANAHTATLLLKDIQVSPRCPARVVTDVD